MKIFKRSKMMTFNLENTNEKKLCNLINELTIYKKITIAKGRTDGIIDGNGFSIAFDIYQNEGKTQVNAYCNSKNIFVSPSKKLKEFENILIKVINESKYNYM